MLTKLEDQLFEQMNRLAKAPPDEIPGEVDRSEAMCTSPPRPSTQHGCGWPW